MSNFLRRSPIFLPLLTFVALILIFSIAIPNFFSLNNAFNILFQSAALGILAAGESLVVLTAGIDLSCAAIMALSGIVMTGFTVNGQAPVVLSILAGLASGAGLGFINGLVITQFRVQPFVVTLGMLSIARSAALIYTNGQQIFNLPNSIMFFGGNFIGPVPIAVIVVLAVYLVVWFIISNSRWGEHIYAIGGNPSAAQRAGININASLLGVYTIAGLLYGISALVQVGRTAIGDPNAGLNGANLSAITAVVIGGISLFGGRGSVIGALFGNLVLAVIINGLTLLNVSALWQLFFTGVLIIAAVIMQTFVQKRRQ
jgi:fructose transport system permease protein